MKRTIIQLLICAFISTLNAQKIKKEYYNNGQLSAIGKYGNNNDFRGKVGEWKYYYRNGQLSVIGSYSVNQHPELKGTGEWKSYYENGKLKSVGNWETENWIWYDKNGKSISTNGIFPLIPDIADSICIRMVSLDNRNIPPQEAIRKNLVDHKVISKNATKKDIGDFINKNFKNLKCKTNIVNSSVKAQHIYQRAFDGSVLNLFYDVILEEEYGININNQFFDKRTQTNITLLDHINYVLNDPYELGKFDEATLNDIRDGIIEMGGKTKKELKGN